jgi:superfamily I DNA and/or RNA helicase
MAGKISNYGVERGHFSAIFIDEAGHATEPETVSAFSNLLSGDDDSTLIMSGDPMQLGPIVRSKNAIKGKLGVSMLERLMGGHSSKLYIRDIENFPATDGYV